MAPRGAAAAALLLCGAVSALPGFAGAATDPAQDEVFPSADQAMSPPAATGSAPVPTALKRPGVRLNASVSSGTHRTDGLHLRNAPPPHRPWDQVFVSRVDTSPHDASGVRKFVLDGVTYDHPVAQAQYGLANLSTFRAHGDRFFLGRARVQADRLIRTRVVSRGAWWLPYPFDFRASASHHLRLRAPWYSGMAQGLALGLFAQLARTPALSPAERAGYRAAADATFRSHLLGPSAKAPWVMLVDRAGYLWIQEYPQDPPQLSDYTLNGHGFGSWGLWEYHSLTGDPLAKRLFEETAATYLHYAAVVRRRGWQSSYCTPHEAPSDRYHAVHARQLLQFQRLTGDVQFARMADAFTRDYASPDVVGRVRLTAGQHRTYTFTRSGSIGNVRLMTRLRSSEVDADRRVRIKGRGYYYRLASGRFAGRYVLEIPGFSVLAGTYLPATYHPAVGHRVAKGRYSVVRITDRITPSRIRVRTDRLAFDQRLLVDGIMRKRIASGPLKGVWLPASLQPDRPPGRPGRPGVLSRDGNAVRLAWSPARRFTSPFTYVVQVHRQGVRGWRTFARTQGTIAPPLRLRSAARLQVRVVAHNASGRSSPSPARYLPAR